MGPRVALVIILASGLSLDGVDLHLDLGIYNPYFFPLRSPQVSYSVDVEGHQSSSWW